MDVIQTFDLAIQDEAQGNGHHLNALLDEIFANKYEYADISKLSAHIEQQYINYTVNIKTTAIYILGKIDVEAACRVARNDIENSYQLFRNYAGHLHSMVIAITTFEGPHISLSSMEHEKNMRLAYALINGKAIIDGDFMPPDKIRDSGHEEFVKKIMSMPST